MMYTVFVVVLLMFLVRAWFSLVRVNTENYRLRYELRLCHKLLASTMDRDLRQLENNAEQLFRVLEDKYTASSLPGSGPPESKDES